MKKMFFYAAVACVAFASCQKEIELPTNVEENEIVDEAIQFQVSNSIDVTTTRGAGAVGDTIGGKNWWNGEKLLVYMFDKGTMNLAIDSTELITLPSGVKGYGHYFANDTITAPNGDAAADSTFNEVTKEYYGPNKYNVYDFFAYHADDATNGAVPGPNDAKDAYEVAVTIDGTQDLMVAKAKMNKADITKYGNSDYDRIYSAYSARRGVHPRFAFEHKLSRFVFKAEAADVDAQGIHIDSIKVRANTTAIMTVAAKDEKKLGLLNWGAPKDLLLKDDEGKPFTKVRLGGKGVKSDLGESMLLEPKAKDPNGDPATYDLIVYYSQMVAGRTEPLKAEFKSEIEAPAKTEKAFWAGYQYQVNIKVYSFQEIILTCDLTAWQDGGSIPVDPEE